MTTLMLLTVLLAGYGLGRIRPAHRASDWAIRLAGRRPAVTRRDYRWWLAQPVYAAQIIVLLATQPRTTLRAWRTRNDPPPPRSPAVRVTDYRSPYDACGGTPTSGRDRTETSRPRPT